MQPARGTFLGGGNAQAAHLRRRPCAHGHLLFCNQQGEAASCRASSSARCPEVCALKCIAPPRALSTRQTSLVHWCFGEVY